jgi:membrane fusion protein (multidrug efflux system)
MKRSVFCVVISTLICSSLVILSFGGCSEKKLEAPPAVEVVGVVQQDVPIFAEWVATLDGMVNATIRAQVQGYLIKQSYKEGDTVKKGQVLFQIDPRTFQAVQEQAQGELERTKARLTQTKANLARIRPLATQRAVSQKDLDDAIAAEQSAQAAVMSAKAVFDKASLDLNFTRITSPIDGIAGIAKAQMGNLVGPGSIEELTTVSTVNPIKAYSGLSEQEYLKAQESRQQAGKVPLQLILADGSVYPYKGEFAFADRQVDVRTGTIRVAALFPNPNNLLRPGQFARLRAQMGLKRSALLVPQRAVTEVQGKYLVAVVGTDNKVVIKQVKAAERFGSLWVIDEGLKVGDKVVAEGVQKVRDGMIVSPKPFKPEAEKKPGKPEEAPAKTEGEKAPGKSETAPKKAEPAGQPKPEKG